MQKRLRQLLRQADLREEEVSLYLCVLKLGRANIAQLIIATKLPSTTAYRTVQRLTERGLLRRLPINAKQSLYEALSLASIAHTLGREQQKLRKLELSLRNLDPLLRYISLDKEDPDDIEIREGRDAFREEYLKMPDVFRDEYLHVGSAPNFWKAALMNYECPEERGFIHRRLGKNLYARVLNTPSPEALEIQKNDSREKRTLVMTEKIPIIKDFVMIAETQVSHFVCDSDNPRVIVIRNPEAVAAQRSHFEMLWKERV